MVADATEIIQKATNKTWNFDRVYSPVEDNRSIYADTAASMIESTISGFNATIFAYGQTGSGKSYTMMGSKSEPGNIFILI